MGVTIRKVMGVGGGEFSVCRIFLHPVLFLVTRLTLHDFFSFSPSLDPYHYSQGRIQKVKGGEGGGGQNPASGKRGRENGI